MSKMNIDITQLSEQELVALNRQIVERLRFMQQMRAHAQMLEFRVGDRVSFQPEGRPVLFGILVRYNKKTVTMGHRGRRAMECRTRSDSKGDGYNASVKGARRLEGDSPPKRQRRLEVKTPGNRFETGRKRGLRADGMVGCCRRMQDPAVLSSSAFGSGAHPRPVPSKVLTADGRCIWISGFSGLPLDQHQIWPSWRVPGARIPALKVRSCGTQFDRLFRNSSWRKSSESFCSTIGAHDGTQVQSNASHFSFHVMSQGISRNS